jgi:hypothetical protein
MPRKWRGALWILASLFILALVHYFVFPFGILPKWASPNCGPEHWRWLGHTFDRKDDVVAYLQEHELELLSGYQTPRLEDASVSTNVPRPDVVIDWQAITNDIQVERRIGYVVYTLTYHHPGCSASQTYAFKVTSLGFASLYGCCGI